MSYKRNSSDDSSNSDGDLNIVTNPKLNIERIEKVEIKRKNNIIENFIKRIKIIEGYINNINVDKKQFNSKLSEIINKVDINNQTINNKIDGIIENFDKLKNDIEKGKDKILNKLKLLREELDITTIDNKSFDIISKINEQENDLAGLNLKLRKGMIKILDSINSIDILDSINSIDTIDNKTTKKKPPLPPPPPSNVSKAYVKAQEEIIINNINKNSQPPKPPSPPPKPPTSPKQQTQNNYDYFFEMPLENVLKPKKKPGKDPTQYPRVKITKKNLAAVFPDDYKFSPLQKKAGKRTQKKHRKSKK